MIDLSKIVAFVPTGETCVPIVGEFFLEDDGSPQCWNIQDAILSQKGKSESAFQYPTLRRCSPEEIVEAFTGKGYYELIAALKGEKEAT